MIDRVQYAACPLCCDAAIADYRTVDCTGHRLYQPASPPECAETPGDFPPYRSR